MREFSIPFVEGLNRGLRPDKRNPRNNQYLTEAYNVKIGKMGIQPLEPLSTDIVSTDTVGWRTPQLFSLAAGIYIGTTAGVYQIGHDLTIGTMVVDSALGGVLNNNWTVADFGQFQVWCDGFRLYIYDVHTDDLGATRHSDFIVTDVAIGEHSALAEPFFRLVENVGGRLFLTADFWIFDPGPGEDPPFVPYWLKSKRVLVAWSRAGVADVGQINAMLALMIGSILNITALEVPGYGNIAMPWQGTPTAMKRLGDKIIVYGSSDYVAKTIVDDEWPRSKGGVGALVQHVSPYPTFGYVPIHDIGTAAGRPVAGDDKRHVFIDADGVMWSLTADLKKERLGYEEYFAPLMYIPNLFVYGSHDSVNDDYYFTIGSVGYGFLLSRNGLSKTYQPVMSIAECTSYPPAGGVQVRSIQSIVRTVGTDLSAYVCTDTLDMGMRAIKTVTGLEIGASNSGAMTANVDYKYNTADPFTSSALKPVHKNGTVTPMVAGTDFRIRVKSASYVDFDLDYMSIRWKINDKRLVRGLHESTSSKAIPGSGG